MWRILLITYSINPMVQFGLSEFLSLENMFIRLAQIATTALKEATQ